MAERDDGTMPSTYENEEAHTQDELKEVVEERPKIANDEAELKDSIAINIASAILHCMRTTFDNESIYKDTIKSGYIQGIVKTKLSAITITQKHATEIFNLIKNMKITLAQENIPGKKVKYTFTFELHDSKGYFISDSSQERCSGILIFIDLIHDLKNKLTNDNESTLFQRIGGLDVTSISVFAEIIYSGSSLMKSKLLCISKQKYHIAGGGSKSRRRHRRHRKLARKTRRGRGRGRSRKSKTKTHRRRRHSRVRKHKKYTYTRRR